MRDLAALVTKVQAELPPNGTFQTSRETVMALFGNAEKWEDAWAKTRKHLAEKGFYASLCAETGQKVFVARELAKLPSGSWVTRTETAGDNPVYPYPVSS